MTIFDKRVSDYVAFSKPILWLIGIVGIARLGLSLGGVPNATVKWLSISIAMLLGLVYSAIRVHTTGFGSYKQLLPVLFVQSVFAESIIIVGIVIAIFTARDNIFSVPEYSGGGDGKTWFHAGAHLVLGMMIGPLLAWLVGCVLMFVTKKIVKTETPMAAA
jgi:hypothetical protein